MLITVHYGRGEMLKKKVNGAWSSLANVKKKTSGSWSDCSTVKKKYSGVWSEVWGKSEVTVNTDFLLRHTDGYWYTSSSAYTPYYYYLVNSDYLFLQTRGSASYSNLTTGYAAYFAINIQAGENIYFDQKYTIDQTGGNIEVRALLFSGKVTTAGRRPYADVNLTTSRQVVTATPTSNTSYLYFFIGRSNASESTTAPSIRLWIYNIYTDSKKYVPQN